MPMMVITRIPGVHGRELYKLDVSGNVTLIEDKIPGPIGSDIHIINFFDGKTIVQNYRQRKFYELTDSGNLIDLIHPLNNGQYEIKAKSEGTDYLIP